MKAINYKTIATLSLLVFVFLLGFSLSVQAYRISQQELNNPVSQYLRENYGVNSIEEYMVKLEQEAWLNISKQMEALASEYPEINFSQWRNPDVYKQYGTSSYQPPKITPQLPFYMAIFSEPVTALQIFSLSGLGLIGLAAVPPIRKNKRLKQALVLGIVTLCVFSIGYFVGLTAAQTGTITIEPGSFTETASYVIWTDGTYVYAKNGKTGQIEFSGSDASTVIQSAVNALGTAGGKIFIKAGTYNISSTIYVRSNVQIIGEGISTVLVQSGNIDLIKTYGFESATQQNYIGIMNLELLGQKGTYSGSAIVGYFWRATFYNVHIFTFSGDGINLYQNNNEIINCWINDLDGYGLRIGTPDNRIIGNYVGGTKYAVLLYGSANQFIGNHIGCYRLSGSIGILVQGTENTIMGNMIDQPGRQAILLEGRWRLVKRNQIIGNYIYEASSESNAAYHAITLRPITYGVQRNIIIGNTFRSEYTNKPGYCILEELGADYNYIAYNDCEDYATGAIYKSGANTVVKNNIGYYTENFKSTGISIAVGTGGAYGTASTITSPSGVITYPRVKITWGGTFDTGETVTVKVEAVYTDGSTAYVEKSATATGSLWLTDDDIMSLITQGKDIVNLNVYAKSSATSTSVTVTVDAYGKA